MQRTLAAKDHSPSRCHRLDYRRLFEANVDQTSGFMPNQQPRRRSSCFCNLTRPTLRTSTDTWPYNYTYEPSKFNKICSKSSRINHQVLFDSRVYTFDTLYILHVPHHQIGQLPNQQLRRRSACFCNPKHLTFWLSTDTWPHSYTYDLSKIIKACLRSSRLAVTKSY